ncbi:MAG: hypothetical protein OXH08_15385 [Gammaproteobacteria bacterium]|nr:hypothetical protein [Gammaproteobacteria bacterium]MDE0650108.1 hypothetical protein [Gammaproteobacteria bacterium]MYH48792.1 hypothetical protein [Gammaproteobacteria bacterium]
MAQTGSIRELTVVMTRRKAMRKNQDDARVALAAFAFALMALGCDDGGLLGLPDDTYNAEGVAALDPESPERWQAEYNRLLAEDADVLQLHRSWFDENKEAWWNGEPSEFFRTWEPPAQRSRCGNGQASEDAIAAIVAAIRARTEGNIPPLAQLTEAIDEYFGVFGRG